MTDKTDQSGSSAAPCSPGFLSRKEANELRCVAHEIIIKLVEAKNQTCLNLLKMHCDAALEKLPPLEENDK